MQKSLRAGQMDGQPRNPIPDDDISRQFWYQFGVIHQDIAPELHRQTAGFYFPVDFQQEVKINSPGTLFLDDGFTVSKPEINGFIAADIELLAAEMGQ